MVRANRLPGGAVLLILCLNMVVAFSARADDDKQVSVGRPMLHTFVEIKAYGENAQTAIEAAMSEMERVNALLNNYDPDSQVSRINRNAGIRPVEISPETRQALQLAIGYADVTGGAFDFTIGPLLKLWGFAQEKARLEGGEPDTGVLKDSLQLVDYRALRLMTVNKDIAEIYMAKLARKNMWIDVGAFSKGYVADRAMAILGNSNIKDALIAAGGTVCVMGEKPGGIPWLVGIRHPREEGMYMGAVPLKDRAISTSGDYERFYKKDGKRKAHIIDPRSGRPVERMQSVSVIAKTGIESDALSTGLFVLGPEKGIDLVDSLPDVEALLVTHDGRVLFSAGWPERKIAY